MPKRVWVDHIVERPRTFNKQENPDGTITLIPAPGQIVQEGTPVNATNLNGIEEDLENKLDLVSHDVSGSKYTLHVDDEGLYLKEV